MVSPCHTQLCLKFAQKDHVQLGESPHLAFGTSVKTVHITKTMVLVVLEAVCGDQNP